MKNPLSLGLALLLAALIAISSVTLASGQDRAANQAIRDRFVGAWRLAWLERQAADGKVHKIDCCGLREPQAQTRHRSPTFTGHVEGALERTLIGKDLPRAYELSGKQLIVKSTRPDEHRRVAWEHY